MYSRNQRIRKLRDEYKAGLLSLEEYEYEVMLLTNNVNYYNPDFEDIDELDDEEYFTTKSSRLVDEY